MTRERAASDIEIKTFGPTLLGGDWAWRCWACGWHGSGLASEDLARREAERHDCQPDEDATTRNDHGGKH